MSHANLFNKNFMVAGIVLAIVFSFLHFLVPYDYSVDILAALTGGAGGVYMGIGLSADNVKKMFIQLAAGALFIIAAVLGLWISPLIFAAAFFVHGAWDIVTVHPKGLNFKIARWYMPMCVGYDFLFALYLLVWFFASANS